MQVPMSKINMLEYFVGTLNQGEYFVGTLNSMPLSTRESISMTLSTRVFRRHSQLDYFVGTLAQSISLVLSFRAFYRHSRLEHFIGTLVQIILSVLSFRAFIGTLVQSSIGILDETSISLALSTRVFRWHSQSEYFVGTLNQSVQLGRRAAGSLDSQEKKMAAPA